MVTVHLTTDHFAFYYLRVASLKTTATFHWQEPTRSPVIVLGIAAPSSPVTGTR